MAKNNKIACPKVKLFKLSEIHPAEYNPRIISDENVTGLANSIAEFGCVELIIVNIRDGKNVIVGGHQRYKVLRATGIEECLCVTVDFDVAKEELLNLSLNNPQIQGQFIADIDAYITKLQAEVGDDLILKLKINQLNGIILQSCNGTS